MSKGLAQRKESEREFLEQLLDTSKVQNYSLPVEIKAQLRAIPTGDAVLCFLKVASNNLWK